MHNSPRPATLKPLTGAGFDQYAMRIDGTNKSAKKHRPSLKPSGILDQLRGRIRNLRKSLSTQEASVYRASTFMRFHRLRHPREMRKAEIEAFLMAPLINVSPSTHARHRLRHYGLRMGFVSRRGALNGTVGAILSWH